jgi:hypothetical protein
MGMSGNKETGMLKQRHQPYDTTAKKAINTDIGWLTKNFTMM